MEISEKKALTFVSICHEQRIKKKQWKQGGPKKKKKVSLRDVDEELWVSIVTLQTLATGKMKKEKEKGIRKWRNQKESYHFASYFCWSWDV